MDGFKVVTCSIMALVSSFKQFVTHCSFVHGDCWFKLMIDDKMHIRRNSGIEGLLQQCIQGGAITITVYIQLYLSINNLHLHGHTADQKLIKSPSPTTCEPFL